MLDDLTKLTLNVNDLSNRVVFIHRGLS